MKIPFTTINIVLTVACLFLLWPIIQETITDESNRAHNEILKRAEMEEAQVVALKARIVNLKGYSKTLMDLLINQRTALEQRVRYETYSGLTEIRGFMTGTQPYHQQLQSGNRCPLSYHNHVSYYRLVGMGEFGAILNGIQFYSRHNDPDIYAPAKNTQDYYANSQISYPPVPPSVRNAGSVAAQTAEMIEYFKAWADQNVTHRDYRPYFHPMLGYVEAGWIHDSVTLSDPFRSERHFIDAKTWEALGIKTRFYMQNGRKNEIENIPYLPRILADVIVDESYVFKAGSDAFVPLGLQDRSQFNTLESLQYLGANTKRGGNDQAAIYLTKTSEGVFINIIFGNRKSSGGTASVAFICNKNNNTGCLSASSRACVNNITDCSSSFTQAGNGNVFSKWAPADFAGVSYGPLTKCFSVSMFISNTDTLKGVMVPLSSKNNFTREGFDDLMIIEGCQSDPYPVVANLDYRVMYVPLDRDIPLNRLKVVDDTSSQMSGDHNNYPETGDSTTRTLQQLEQSRNALFKFNGRDQDDWIDASGTYELLDELMETIPGRDGYGAFLNETFDGELAYHYVRRNEVLNAAYYNRFYSVNKNTNGIESKEGRRRGFNDVSLFAAKSSRKEIVPVRFPDPITGEIQEYRYSYAFPIELIYRTPLSDWNPYGVPMNEYAYYTVPYQFYEDYSTIYRDPSDTNGLNWGQDVTTYGAAYVTGAGHWIQMPKITGIHGRLLRQRWPCAPVANSKNPGIQAIRALKHMLSMENKKDLLKNTKLNQSTILVTIWLGNSTTQPAHTHRIKISSSLVDTLAKGTSVVVTTEYQEDLGHRHALTVTASKNADGSMKYAIKDCDGAGVKCADGHAVLCGLSPLVTNKCK